MRQAMKEGRYLSRAPVGYINVKGEKRIKIDDRKSLLIKELFDTYSKGIYSAEEVRRLIAKKGLVCSKQNFLNILTNVFYIGKIKIPAYQDEPEQVVLGLHQPIISEELFNDVQDVLQGKKRKTRLNLKRNDTFPLRGFLECKICGGKLTGSGSKGRHGDIHYYYHCQLGCKERFRAKDANTDFELFLKSFTIPDEILKLYYVILEDAFKVDEKERKDEIKSIEKDIYMI